MFFSTPVCRKPISGMQVMTRSPSSSRIRRSTPCVEGCCGPMLRMTVSPLSARSETRWRYSARRGSSKGAASSVVPLSVTDASGGMPRMRRPESLFGIGLLPVDLVEVERELDLFIAQRVILAQRMPLPIRRHEQPAQIRVAREADAEHVENLALVPVGAGEDLHHTRHARRVAREVEEQSQAEAFFERVQLVDHGEAGLIRPVVHRR